jgi:hypothetical protein
MGSAQRCRGLSPRECADWLVHSREGKAWAGQRGGTMSMAGMVADLVERSRNAADEANMRP